MFPIITIYSVTCCPEIHEILHCDFITPKVWILKVAHMFENMNFMDIKDGINHANAVQLEPVINIL